MTTTNIQRRAAALKAARTRKRLADARKAEQLSDPASNLQTVSRDAMSDDRRKQLAGGLRPRIRP